MVVVLPNPDDFPSFSEGLSLRVVPSSAGVIVVDSRFPFLFGGTFIEGQIVQGLAPAFAEISLPFRRDFH